MVEEKTSSTDQLNSFEWQEIDAEETKVTVGLVARNTLLIIALSVVSSVALSVPFSYLTGYILHGLLS